MLYDQYNPSYLYELAIPENLDIRGKTSPMRCLTLCGWMTLFEPIARLARKASLASQSLTDVAIKGNTMLVEIFEWYQGSLVNGFKNIDSEQF